MPWLLARKLGPSTEGEVGGDGRESPLVEELTHPALYSLPKAESTTYANSLPPAANWRFDGKGHLALTSQSPGGSQYSASSSSLSYDGHQESLSHLVPSSKSLDYSLLLETQFLSFACLHPLGQGGCPVVMDTLATSIDLTLSLHSWIVLSGAPILAASLPTCLDHMSQPLHDVTVPVA